MESVAESREKVYSSGGGALFAQEHNALWFLHCSGFLFWVFFFIFFFHHQFVVVFLFLFHGYRSCVKQLACPHVRCEISVSLLYSAGEYKSQELKDLSGLSATVVNVLDKIIGDGEHEGSLLSWFRDWPKVVASILWRLRGNGPIVLSSSQEEPSPSQWGETRDELYLIGCKTGDKAIIKFITVFSCEVSVPCPAVCMCWCERVCRCLPWTSLPHSYCCWVQPLPVTSWSELPHSAREGKAVPQTGHLKEKFGKGNFTEQLFFHGLPPFT